MINIYLKKVLLGLTHIKRSPEGVAAVNCVCSDTSGFPCCCCSIVLQFAKQDVRHSNCAVTGVCFNLILTCMPFLIRHAIQNVEVKTNADTVHFLQLPCSEGLFKTCVNCKNQTKKHLLCEGGSHLRPLLLL